MTHFSGVPEKKIPLNPRRAVIAAVVSAVFTVILMLLFSFVVNISLLPEGAVPVLSILLTMAGAFFAGFLTALSVPSYGLFNGMLSGIAYFLIMYVFSSAISLSLAINSKFFVNLIICIAGAGAGGILSINLKANRKSRKRRR